jgi:hypothetical protein
MRRLVLVEGQYLQQFLRTNAKHTPQPGYLKCKMSRHSQTIKSGGEWQTRTLTLVTVTLVSPKETSMGSLSE